MRQTHRSSKGPKLYRISTSRSRFEDILKYKKDHKRDKKKDEK